MIVEYMGQVVTPGDPGTAIRTVNQDDLRWLDSLLDTAKGMTETIIGTAAAKAEQERRQAFELQRLRLTMPTAEQMSRAMPWFVIGIPAAILLVALLRRRR